MHNRQLIEAYMGRFDCSERDAIFRINNHTPEERLEVYLEWEGIIGFTSTIIAILKGPRNEAPQA